jgi:hypothetical protein
MGIRDIAEIENISIKKVLSVLVHSRHMIRPGQPYYDCLEVDDFGHMWRRRITRYG